MKGVEILRPMRLGLVMGMLQGIMKTNVSMVLLEIQHPLSTGLPVYLRPHKVGTVQKIGVFRMFVMGVIDDRDGLTR